MDRPEHGSPDPGAFERLIEEYADRVYNIALRITGDPSEAEDAIQEAFLSAYHAWASFRGESSPRTWLYRITVNAALTSVRKRRFVASLSELADEEDVQDWSESVADLVQRSELQEFILSGLGRLEPEQRAALVLRDIDGLSTSEAADALDISEAALKSRLHRGRLLLRQLLAEYFRER